MDSNTRWRRNQKDKIDKIFGSKCCICFAPRECLHEIHGKKHPINYKSEELDYVFSHKEDFVGLCMSCHTTIHHEAKRPKKNLTKFAFLVSLLRQEIKEPKQTALEIIDYGKAIKMDFIIHFICSFCKEEVIPERLVFTRQHIYALHCNILQEIGIIC